jgi:hypothetical protein
VESLTVSDADVSVLREQLTAMSDVQLRACGRAVVESCRLDLGNVDPDAPQETLLAEVRAEARRRIKPPRRYEVSKGLDYLDNKTASFLIG